MNRKVGLLVAALVAAVALYLALRPSGNPHRQPAPASTTTSRAPVADAASPATPTSVDPPAPETVAEPAPQAPPTPDDPIRATFVEAYCAHTKGELQRLVEIYKAHGFEDPKAWTEAFTAKSEDKEWVARSLAQAQARCP